MANHQNSRNGATFTWLKHEQCEMHELLEKARGDQSPAEFVRDHIRMVLTGEERQATQLEEVLFKLQTMKVSLDRITQQNLDRQQSVGNADVVEGLAELDAFIRSKLADVSSKNPETESLPTAFTECFAEIAQQNVDISNDLSKLHAAADKLHRVVTDAFIHGQQQMVPSVEEQHGTDHLHSELQAIKDSLERIPQQARETQQAVGIADVAEALAELDTFVRSHAIQPPSVGRQNQSADSELADIAKWIAALNVQYRKIEKHTSTLHDAVFPPNYNFGSSVDSLLDAIMRRQRELWNIIKKGSTQEQINSQKTHARLQKVTQLLLGDD